MSIDPSTDCPFCQRIHDGGVSEEGRLVVAFPDRYSVSPGHTLVVPRRHEADFFALTEAEQSEMLKLASRIREALPDVEAFNIGINAGAAAGQTVPHAHLHLIPRFAGDVDDPRGGVRWVIAEKAAYWEE